MKNSIPTLAAIVSIGLFVVGVSPHPARGQTQLPGKVPDKPAVAPAAAQPAATEADEKAIRATADDFIKAFNAGDAKAVGALWATDAIYTDELARSYHGREAIAKEYADLFKEHHGATMTVNIESIRFFGPDIAVEKGVAQVSLPAKSPGKSPAADAPLGARYTVVHARRDGKWIMVVGRDDPYVPGGNDDYLRDLAWLIGDWKFEGKDRTLLLHFEWMPQKNFIKNTFTVTKEGKSSLTGGQIIGWNPKRGRIVSWHFEAEGGFGDDLWTKDNGVWVIEAQGVSRNGSESTAVNLLTPVDVNHFTWQSVKRTLDGVALPDIPPVTLTKVQPSK